MSAIENREALLNQVKNYPKGVSLAAIQRGTLMSTQQIMAAAKALQGQIEPHIGRHGHGYRMAAVVTCVKNMALPRESVAISQWPSYTVEKVMGRVTR